MVLPLANYNEHYYYSNNELERLLKDAINKWDPTLPRRWLYQYGYLHHDGRRSPLHPHYCTLRAQALMKTRRAPLRHAQSWPAEGLRLVL